MAKIRKDFEGVIYARAGADVVRLAAGDDVPEGADVAVEHTDGESEKVKAEPEKTPEPKKRATRSTKAAADDSGDEG